MTTEDKINYDQAVERVKKIKGFFSHAIVYFIVNLMIVVINIQNLDPGESYFQYENFVTAFFWGIGLGIHGIKIFIPNLLFGSNWEAKKIKEIMEKDSKKWE